MERARAEGVPVKKLVITTLVLALALTLGLPAVSGDEAKDVKLSGWITDEWCGAANANADGASCARHCAKNGAQLVLFSDGKLYKLSDQKVALEHVGHKVDVSGKLKGEDTIEVAKIEACDKC